MNKKSPFMIAHVILTVALILLNAAGLFVFIFQLNTAEGSEIVRILLNVFMMMMFMAMLIVGITYLLNNYGKHAAFFLKAFLLLQVIITVLTVIIDLSFGQIRSLVVAETVLYAFKILFLLALTFWKNLGKERSFVLFFSILVIDVVALILAIVYMSKIGFDFSLAGYIAAIIADGTTGLALRGKYKDKEARGTV